MSKRKAKQPTAPTFPTGNESALEHHQEAEHAVGTHFEPDDPLISGFGGHYGHQSELEGAKPQRKKPARRRKKINRKTGRSAR